MSAVVAYLVLVGIALAAGFGGGLAFALALSWKLSKAIDARISQWLRAADEQLRDRPRPITPNPGKRQR